MLHQLRTGSLPRFSRPQRISPKIAEDPEVRVAQVIRFGDGLAFRAQGAAPGGVYLEPQDGLRTMLAPDTPRHLMMRPRAAGAYVAIEASVQGVAPGRIQALVFVGPDGRPPTAIPGQAVAVAADQGAALVANLDTRRLVRVDLADLSTEEVAPLRFESQEQPAPLLSLSPDGSAALIMEVEGGRVDLVHLELSSGARTVVLEGLPEPSWATGAFPAGGGLVVLEMVHDLAPRFRLLRFDAGQPAQTLLTLGHPQPASIPAFVDKAWMALPLALEPHPVADIAPPDLVLVPLGGGAQSKLTTSGDVTGWAHRTEDALYVEGGPQLLRFVPQV